MKFMSRKVGQRAVVSLDFSSFAFNEFFFLLRNNMDTQTYLGCGNLMTFHKVKPTQEVL